MFLLTMLLQMMAGSVMVTALDLQLRHSMLWGITTTCHFRWKI